MSLISCDWLLHGCMKLSGDQIEPASRAIRRRIAAMYGGKGFAIKGWPQRSFREVIWWYEKSEIPSNVASYFLRLDNSRGPNLYAGITVEKGIEDRELAKNWAAKREEPVQRFLLSENWDWHRFVSSPTQTVSLINSASKDLHKELYIWLEFGHNKLDSRYYLVKDTDLYWRGGFAPVSWEELFSFVTQPRPKEWGNVFLARAFGIDECDPYLSVDKLMDVFNAMRPIRDLWRGLISASE